MCGPLLYVLDDLRVANEERMAAAAVRCDLVMADLEQKRSQNNNNMVTRGKSSSGNTVIDRGSCSTNTGSAVSALDMVHFSVQVKSV